MLSRLRGQKTIILITHSVELVEVADRQVVITDGEIESDIQLPPVALNDDPGPSGEGSGLAATVPASEARNPAQSALSVAGCVRSTEE